MSWTSPQENYNGTIVSVVSLTCQKQKESQRLEKQYCTQVKERKGCQAHSPPAAQPRRRCQGATVASSCAKVSLVHHGYRSQEVRAQGSAITVTFLSSLRTTVFLLLPFLIQEHILSTCDVLSTGGDGGNLDDFYTSCSCWVYSLERTIVRTHVITAEYKT